MKNHRFDREPTRHVNKTMGKNYETEIELRSRPLSRFDPGKKTEQLATRRDKSDKNPITARTIIESRESATRHFRRPRNREKSVKSIFDLDRSDRRPSRMHLFARARVLFSVDAIKLLLTQSFFAYFQSREIVRNDEVSIKYTCIQHLYSYTLF